MRVVVTTTWLVRAAQDNAIAAARTPRVPTASKIHKGPRFPDRPAPDPWARPAGEH